MPITQAASSARRYANTSILRLPTRSSFVSKKNMEPLVSKATSSALCNLTTKRSRVVRSLVSRKPSRATPTRTLQLTFATASQTPSQQEMDDMLEKSKELLDTMMMDMRDEMSKSQFSSDSGEGQEERLRSMAKVVRKYTDSMDGAFLATLNAYVQAANATGDESLVTMLTVIRDEVLLCITDTLPAPVQVVDKMARTASQAERKQILTLAISGGRDDIPAVKPTQVARAAGTIIDDMERAPEVPNWQLLMRMVAVREYVRRLGLPEDDNDSAKDPQASISDVGRTTVPKNQGLELEFALMNNLLTVGDPLKRKSLIKFAFERSQEADKGQAEKRAKDPKLQQQTQRRRDLIKPKGIVGEVAAAAAAAAPLEPQQRLQSPGVRPGRLLDCLLIARRELEYNNYNQVAKTEGTERTVIRLCEISIDVLEVVEDMS